MTDCNHCNVQLFSDCQSLTNGNNHSAQFNKLKNTIWNYCLFAVFEEFIFKHPLLALHCVL